MAVEIVNMNSDKTFDEVYSQAVAQEPIIEETPQEEVVEQPVVENIEAQETPQAEVTPEPTITPEPPQATTEPIDYWKELGVDDDGKKVLEAWKQGKLDEYLSIKNANYDAIPDEELLRMQLKQEYPTMSQDKLDRLYNKKLNAYGLTNEFDEEAVLDGKVQLEADMQKVRDGLKQKQSEYQIGEYKAPQQVQEDEYRKQQEALSSYMDSVDYFKQLETSKSIKLTNDLNFSTPQGFNAKELAKNPDKLMASFWNADGTFKAAEFADMVNYRFNSEMVKNTMINHGKSLGKKEADDYLRNPSSRASQDVMPSTSPKIVITKWGNG